MVSATKQNEYVKQSNVILLFKSILRLIFLGNGFYLATKGAGIEVMENVFIVSVLVIIGIYMLFGGFIPFLFQLFTKHKKFLYKKQRNLWINNVVFRMKKIIEHMQWCVLMFCSVTALAFGFAMKNRSDNINHFENTYAYQIFGDEFTSLIQNKNSIDYSSEIEISVIPNEITDNKFESTPYAILSYLQVKQIAKDTGLKLNLSESKDNEFINLGRLYLMSLTDDRILNTNMINDKIYKSVSNTTVPYFRYFQENMEFMIVNDNVYKELSKYWQSMYFYNYKLTEPRNFELSVKDI